MSSGSPHSPMPSPSTILSIQSDQSLWAWISIQAETLKKDFSNVRCLLLERYEDEALKIWRFPSTLEAMRTKEVFIKFRGKDHSNLVILTFDPTDKIAE
ncbi:MAG: hypothetical protein ACW981_10845 [Candidatus Hodarchaeales archaeon]